MASAPNPWFFAGLASAFPNIAPSSADTSSTSGSKTKIRDTSDASADIPPPCKIFRPSPAAVELTADEAQGLIGLEPQVLIFRYRNKIHAIDHACPHRTYPLSRGALYDIEDFGIVLSAGITCPKHGWAFDINTGQSDRGTYRLGVWEVEARAGGDGEEVWVRKKAQQSTA
ncbi:hypothetical protein LTR36_005820 [Oleoguttula mirabilis]|uniref:Rieske domain-containing protein n=1 Tax=Oleoguttula mirabilis TaxID=1507867 RepID=A0AAV9JD22_9PEZI|nr:hypothetical protein LTR36_005820 [Oleoguttula mirabilis]